MPLKSTAPTIWWSIIECHTLHCAYHIVKHHASNVQLGKYNSALCKAQQYPWAGHRTGDLAQYWDWISYQCQHHRCDCLLERVNLTQYNGVMQIQTTSISDHAFKWQTHTGRTQLLTGVQKPGFCSVAETGICRKNYCHNKFSSNPLPCTTCCPANCPTVAHTVLPMPCQLLSA